MSGQLRVTEIRTDGGTQTRIAVNPETANEYMDAMQGGAEFPPVVVFYDGSHYWLADGFHRHKATCQLQRPTIAADVRQGTRRDAVLYSVGANESHGLRRNKYDRRRAIETLLRDPEWRQWSDREIARRCGVSPSTVGTVRSELVTVQLDSDNGTAADDTRTYTNKHGGVTVMNTSGIRAAHATPAPIQYIPFDSQDFATEAPDDVPAVQVEETDDETPLTPYEEVIASMHRVTIPADQDATAPAVAIPISQRENYESDEWYTPAAYLDMARAVMGRIDLDPASCDIAQRTVRAHVYCTKEDDGLTLEWYGNIWCNPPFSMAEDFALKAIEEYDAGHAKQAVLLFNSSTDTKWFHALAARFPMCFTKGRISFLRDDGSEIKGNRQGQVFFYLGPDAARFSEVFSTIGLIAQFADNEEATERLAA